MNKLGSSKKQYDVIVVGAGMAGLYLLHKLRVAGFSAIALETVIREHAATSRA